MKSLEIVNKKINYCEEQEVPFVSMRLVSFQQIKQDLESLEIIRKNLLRSKYGVYESKNNGVVEYNKVTMREIKEDEFDREEFNKLKQWLEENE